MVGVQLPPPVELAKTDSRKFLNLDVRRTECRPVLPTWTQTSMPLRKNQIGPWNYEKSASGKPGAGHSDKTGAVHLREIH